MEEKTFLEERAPTILVDLLASSFSPPHRHHSSQPASPLSLFHWGSRLAFHRRQISTVVARWPSRTDGRTVGVTLEMLEGNERREGNAGRQAATGSHYYTTTSSCVLTRQRKASLTACVCMWKSHRRKEKGREGRGNEKLRKCCGEERKKKELNPLPFQILTFSFSPPYMALVWLPCLALPRLRGLMPLLSVRAKKSGRKRRKKSGSKCEFRKA